MDRRLVDHFVNQDLISRAEMQRAILRAKKNKIGVVDQLLNSEQLAEDVIAQGVAQCYGYNLLDVSDGFDADPNAYNLISGSVAKKHSVLPFELDGDAVKIIVFNAESVADVLGTLKTATGGDPEVFVASKSFVESAIGHYYDSKEWPDKPDSLIFEPEPISDAEELDLDVDEVFSDLKRQKTGTKKPIIIDDPPTTNDTPTRKVPVPPKPQAAAISKPKTAKRPQIVQKPVTPEPPSEEEVADVQAALDDFDAFLDQSDFLSGAPGVQTDADPLADDWAEKDDDGGFDLSGWDDVEDVDEDDELPEMPQEGFDLFEPSEVELTLADIVDRQQRAISKLHQELKGQREVVSSLVDILVEERVINRKELMKLVKKKRNT